MMDKPIFVFGSNLAGRHGAGAALYAKQHHGAVYGVGRGRMGNSYALPTKGFRIETLPIEYVRRNVEDFIRYAVQHPELKFQVTRVGCGLAGFTDLQIGPMFSNAPSNCELPEEWFQYRAP